MRLKTLSKGLALVCQWSAAAIFIFVCGLNFSQVFGRYVLGSSIPWGEEIMRYSMIWVMMLGGPATIANTRQTAAASGISMFWVYLAIPAGALLMLIQIVLCAISGFASANAEPERL